MYFENYVVCFIISLDYTNIGFIVCAHIKLESETTCWVYNYYVHTKGNL